MKQSATLRAQSQLCADYDAHLTRELNQKRRDERADRYYRAWDEWQEITTVAAAKEARAVLLDDKGAPKLDAQRLRDNNETRDVAKAAFEKMKGALDGMIVSKRKRALDLDDN